MRTTAIALVGLSCCLAAGTTAVGAEESGARLDMWVSADLPFDPEAPKVRITFSYTGGEKPITLELPTTEHISDFRELRAFVNGQAADYKTSPRVNGIMLEDDFIYEDRRTLTPNTSLDLVVPLKEVFIIAEDWKTIELLPVQMHSLKGTSGTLVIHREHLRYEQLESGSTGPGGDVRSRMPSVTASPAPPAEETVGHWSEDSIRRAKLCTARYLRLRVSLPQSAFVVGRPIPGRIVFQNTFDIEKFSKTIADPDYGAGSNSAPVDAESFQEKRFADLLLRDMHLMPARLRPGVHLQFQRQDSLRLLTDLGPDLSTGARAEARIPARGEYVLPFDLTERFYPAPGRYRVRAVYWSVMGGSYAESDWVEFEVAPTRTGWGSWPIAIGTTLAGLLLGFVLAALLFRRRRA